MSRHADAQADGLARFIDAAPSPYHAVAECRAMLIAAGFVELAETEPWPAAPGRYVVVREGALVAWSAERAAPPGGPFRVVGAHTDSPNLRIRPHPDLSRLGWDQLGVDVYGGALLNSWLDRDLGLSGRVAVRDPGAPGGVSVRLVRVDEPLLRVAQLAIHLDRDVNDGLRLNPQTHLTPIWGATGAAPTFRAWLAGAVGVDPGDVLSWDVMAHDLTPSRRLGHAGDLLAAPRLDNLASCYAGTSALVAALERLAGRDHPGALPVLVLFDHEEIGSTTSRGAASPFLPATLERIVSTQGGDRTDVLRALAGSLVCSADMAHAVHPNYPERFEPAHLVTVGGGPVLKVNAKGRYASDAPGSAAFVLACEQAGVPMQTFITRGDLPSGSTIGPLTAAVTGAVTVDVGAPMLSMHSARELMGAADVGMYVDALTAVLAPAG